MANKSSKMTVGSILNKLIERTNTNTRRLRSLEQERLVMLSRLDSLEENVLAVRKDISKEMAAIKREVDQQSARLDRIESNIKEVINQLKKTITSTKLKELETLVEIYNPLKSQFVTKEEVERMLRER